MDAILGKPTKKPMFEKEMDEWGDVHDYGELQHFGEDNFYAVPMKVLGFPRCRRSVSFKKNGRYTIKHPRQTRDYEGYWWDRYTHSRMDKIPPLIEANYKNEEYRYEYYYYLNNDYYDN